MLRLLEDTADRTGGALFHALVRNLAEALGHLATPDIKPQPESSDYLSVFRIFAARAAAEMRRQRAQAALREREQRLSGLVDGVMDGIIDFGADLSIRLMKVAAARCLVRDPASGGSLERLLDADSVARVRATITQLQQAQPPSSRSAPAIGGSTAGTTVPSSRSNPALRETSIRGDSSACRTQCARGIVACG